MFPRLQFKFALRLCLTKVLVRGIERDGLAVVHEGFRSVDDQVVMAGAFLEPSGSRRQLVTGDFELYTLFLGILA